MSSMATWRRLSPVEHVADVFGGGMTQRLHDGADGVII